MTSTPAHGQGWAAIRSRIASVLAIVTPSAWAVLPRRGPDGGVCHAGERARGAGCVDAALCGLLHHGGLAPCSGAGGWGPARAVAHRLLVLLVAAFVPTGPVVVGIDDTIERRWGAKIKARGIYRDPVRSSHGHFVKASGLRWLCVMLLAPIPWAGCVWALPF